ncbi:MAG: hypothetical protein JSV56_06255, partial [Methanomassiliicoccales archaeon]
MMIFLLEVAFPPITKAGDSFEIFTGEGLQNYPAAAWNANLRKYLAVWYNHHEPGIYGVRLDPDGNPDGEPFEIASIENSGSANHAPSIACNPGKDQCLVTWQDDTSSSLSTDIYAALVSFDETTPTKLNIPKIKEKQLFPKVAWNGEQFLIVWYDFRNGAYDPPDMESADIYGIRLDPNGKVLDPDSLAICTDDLGQVD